MLKKNKNCIEFSMRSMMVTHKPYQEDTEIGITGMIPGCEILAANNPFDIPCEVVMVPKREFEKMQADVNINAEIAKQWEINYDLLLKKIGFDTVEELVNYLDSEAECDTLREAIASLVYSVKFARDERRDLSKKLDECEKDYISERDKAEALQTENEQLKKKLQESDPFPEYKELLEKLHSKEDVEKFEWTLNHICGGKASANGWMVTAKLWRKNYETLSKLVGFSSTEEIQDYLTNEAECDTLQEAIYLMCKEMDRRQKKIDELRNEVKYTSEKWCDANSSNNSWKAAAECNSPKELIEKLNLLRDDISGRSTVIDHYKRDIEKWQKATGCLRPEDISTASLVTKAMQLDQEVKILNGALQEWKEGTGCPGPIAAKTLIESGMSYEYAYHEAQKENRKLTDEVDSWKNVTGYSTPEDYMHARISGAFHTPFDYTATWQKATGCDTPEQAKSHIKDLEEGIRLLNRNMLKELDSEINEWQKATGCSTPEQAKERIKALNERIDESEADYNHLLCTTGFESEGEIEDALDKCDHSTLRKALVDYEFDYEALLKFTGYKSEHDIRVMLNGEKYQYKTMRELINSLERKVKFTEANWQKATGCDTPGRAEEKLEFYKERLGNAVQAASCAAKHLDNITF